MAVEVVDAVAVASVDAVVVVVVLMVVTDGDGGGADNNRNNNNNNGSNNNSKDQHRTTALLCVGFPRPEPLCDHRGPQVCTTSAAPCNESWLAS